MNAVNWLGIKHVEKFCIGEDCSNIGYDSGEMLYVKGTMRLVPQSSGGSCTSQNKGEIYFDSDDNHFYGCNGSAWVQLDN